jgi:hypothetical protein
MASSRGSLLWARRSAARDAQVVVVRVGLLHRLPDDLVAPHRLPVDHGRHLEVRRAQVEADAAAAQVGTELQLALVSGGYVCERDADHLEGAQVYLLTHETGIESVVAVHPVCRLDALCCALRPGDKDPVPAVLPQQELEQPFGVEQVLASTGMSPAKATVSKRETLPSSRSNAITSGSDCPEARTSDRKARFASAAGRKAGSSGGTNAAGSISLSGSSFILHGYRGHTPLLSLVRSQDSI